MTDRVTFDESSELDEVVGTAGGHLENLGDNRWFLIFDHADGSQSAFWFTSRELCKPFWEKRDMPSPLAPRRRPMSDLSGFGYEEYRQLCDKLSRTKEHVRMLEMDNDRLKEVVIRQKAQLWDFRGPEKIRADALEEAALILETYPLAKVPPQNMSWFGEIIDSIRDLKSEEPTR